MHEIVVGVDESQGAANALRWAVREAEVGDAAVTAVLAWGLLDQHRPITTEAFSPGYDEGEALAALDGMVVTAVGAEDAAGVRRRAVCDLAAPALIEAAAGADLLVVGRRGLGGFRELLLGSVSNQCVQGAPCPVAVIGEWQEGGAGDVGRVVVGVDGSDTSRRALRWAIEEACARKAGLEVVHVWHAPYLDGYGAAYAGMDVDEYERSGRAILADMLDAEDTSRLAAPVEQILLQGGVANGLLGVAAGAGLIVIGSRGRGGLARLLLGSVSHQVLHHATCPVVVVPSAR